MNSHYNVIHLCKKYNIVPIYTNVICDATGIGDILFRILCIKNKLINCPFNINLVNFTKPYYMSDPINQLEFRMQLIMDLLKYNNIDNNSINFTFSNNMDINTTLPYIHINNFKLYIDDVTTYSDTDKYIIFHTKCRHDSTEDYTFLKNKIRTFCKTFKSKYKIYIMGEQIFPITEEVIAHGITTIYNELLELKNHNDVIDISIKNIYNNLDYNNYKKDVFLIKNATYNICFGQGGQLCTSLILGNSTIVYYKINDVLNDEFLKSNNHFHCKTIPAFLNLITKKCSLQPSYNAYFLSHSGLGDNITCISAIKFLLQYYDVIFFLCKDIYEDNVKLLFNNMSVIVVPFDSKNEINACTAIINNISDTNTDLLISGDHTKYIKTKITHPELLKYKQNDKHYHVKYEHIRTFYYDIGLDLSIYMEYFDIESNRFSKQLYENVKKYKIVFIHTKSGTGDINIDNIINFYKNNEEFIVICANNNVYNMSHSKYNLAESCVNIPITYYIDIIKNAAAIHVINSCFSCIIYPLITTKKITPIECIIYDRNGIITPMHFRSIPAHQLHNVISHPVNNFKKKHTSLTLKINIDKSYFAYKRNKY